MEKLPVVAICGRPNVGKSTLFNVLSCRKISIVDPTYGVTRDRVSVSVDIANKRCLLVDTGGFGLEKETEFGTAIAEQARKAIREAELVLFMVDLQAGLAPLDEQVAGMLRKDFSDKTVWLLGNKADNDRVAMEKHQFLKLGFGEPFCVSAAHYNGIAELKEKIVDYLPAPPETQRAEPPLKIAVVGKANAGKSTLVNSLAQEERVIVSEIPGTTRDSIDVYIEKDGKLTVIIDTAGLKRVKNVRGSVDFYSQSRAQRAIRRADVVLFMCDATQEVCRIDKQIAEYIREEYKPSIIVINKWDLAKDYAGPEAYEKYFAKMIPGFGYAPMSFTTAKTGKNLAATLDLARNLFKQAGQRVSTGELNRVLKQVIIAKRRPPIFQGKQGKIYYATQASMLPPTFVLFVNDPSVFPSKYRRYLFNQFQKQFGFSEVPVKLELRERRQENPNS